LTEPTHDYIKESVELYKESIRNSPVQIIKDLKYRGDKSKLPEYARKRLMYIEDKVKNISCKSKGYIKPGKHNKTISIKEKLISRLLLGILVLCILFFIIGTITVISWFINLF
jgi:cell division protein FtsB